MKIGNAELVGIQKKVILHARRDNKTVITAPQMMESMIHNLTPTRESPTWPRPCLTIGRSAANHFPGIKAIICLTESGYTPLVMSRISSSMPIFAYSPHC